VLSLAAAVGAADEDLGSGIEVLVRQWYAADVLIYLQAS